MKDQFQITAPRSHFFAGQFQHLLLLAALLPGAIALGFPTLDGSTWHGITDKTWFIACLIVPIAHQILVWFVWRSQLCFHLFTRIFKRADLFVWGMIFIPFLLARPTLLIGLSISNADTLDINAAIATIVGVTLLVPVFYSLWSVHKYFGVARALGDDHFRESARHKPIVRKGAFRWSSNAMYAFAFLGLWSIALIGRSQAALAIALFQHAYVWVHMYCTETPDMRLIYADLNT